MYRSKSITYKWMSRNVLVALVCPNGHPSAPVISINHRAAAAARFPALEKDVPAWFHARIVAALCATEIGLALAARAAVGVLRIPGTRSTADTVDCEC